MWGRDEKARRIRPDGLRGKDGALRSAKRYGIVRALSHVMAVSAAALVLFVTFSPAHANGPVPVLPLEMPEAIAQLRMQPALGPTMLPLAPGQQALTDTLLANYVERQKALRSVEIVPGAHDAELTDDVLMGYISRGSFGGDNTALTAIASFTRPTPRPEPSVTPDLLAAYVQQGYQPTAVRLAHADTERECLAQAIYHEARGESAFGQRAVANVIVNRARSDRYPSTLCGVIYQNANLGLYRCQFTFACDGRDDTPGERRAWSASMALAAEIYAEYATGEEIGALPGSALFYHTTQVQPAWSNTFSRVAAVDSHIFYAPN